MGAPASATPESITSAPDTIQRVQVGVDLKGVLLDVFMAAGQQLRQFYDEGCTLRSHEPRQTSLGRATLGVAGAGCAAPERSGRERELPWRAARKATGQR